MLESDSKDVLNPPIYTLYKMMKIKKYPYCDYRFVYSVIILCLVFCIGASSAFAKQAKLQIRLGEYDTYSRVVFDWSSLVGYKVTQEADRLVLSFNAGAKSKVKIPSTQALSRVQGINILSQNKDSLEIEVLTGGNLKAKDFRLVRRIVVDVSGQLTQQKSTQKQPSRNNIAKDKVAKKKPAPVKSVPVVPVDQVEEPIPLTPTKRPTTLTKDKAKPAKPIDKNQEKLKNNLKNIVTKTAQGDHVQIDNIEVQTTSNTNATNIIDTQASTAPPRQPTVITISTIEPTGLAVFTRFGYLWVVLDSELGTIEPERFGPLADDLGRPDIYDSQNGVAYRFTLSEKQFISTRRENLAWQVILSDVEQPEFSDAYVEPLYDAAGKNARLIGYFNAIRRVMPIADPIVGDTIYVVPTRQADQKQIDPILNSDVQILKTALGFAAVARHEKLGISIPSKGEIEISLEGGLNLSSPASRISEIKSFSNDEETDPQDIERLFNLKTWQKGGTSKFAKNRLELLEQLITAKEDKEISDLMFELALLHFANGFGHEALGYLDVVAGYDEDILKRPSFLAIRGAANALAGRYDDAISDLGTPALQQQPEAQLWRGFAAAATEQWKLAGRLFPDNNILLNGYPKKLAITLTLYMAESALRQGNAELAAKFLDSLSNVNEDLPLHHEAGLRYLRGEMFRQNDQPARALKEWSWVINARDRLYQAKARLAKVLLDLQQEHITEEQALEILENNMRFAWRDDGLETQILQNIGRLQLTTGRYYDGLVQLKDTIRLARYNREDTQDIAKQMKNVFFDLFVNGKASTIPALEAISIYSEFPELQPTGKDRAMAAINFTEYLVKVDLLDRAAQTLEDTLKSTAIQDAQIPHIGTRLASIYLLNGQPNEAISALQRTGRKNINPDTQEERQLLRARALSEIDLTDEAITAISAYNSIDSDRLRADIYWRAGRWNDSAEALFTLMPPPDKIVRLSPEQAGYVLNAAVALKLAGNTQVLAAVRQDFLQLMSRTALATSFNVVTRPVGRATLSDRETMLKIAGEVDIFKGFLDKYRNQDNES